MNPRYQYPNTDKPPIFGPKFSPSWRGPTLMARGCFGALRLAAARPTHDTDSWKQAYRQGVCVRETKTIIGKAPRLGIHTPNTALVSRVRYSGRNIGGQSCVEIKLCLSVSPHEHQGGCVWEFSSKFGESR